MTGSGSGSGDSGQAAPPVPETIDQIRSDEMDARIQEILHDEVASLFQDQLSKMFGSIKIAMMEYFDYHYTALTKAAVAAATMTVTTAGVGASQAFQYRDFDNTKPLTFDGTQDPIKSIRWLYDVEGCFFTCSCPTEQKVRCALNLLRSGAKDWWRLITGSYYDY